MVNDFIVITYGDSQRFFNDIDNMSLFVSKLGKPLKRYTRDWLLTTDYYEQNKIVLDDLRFGGGWWAWKSFIIMDALKEYERVLYMDANTIFNKDKMDDIITFVNSIDVVGCFGTEFCNKDWTKQKCFDIMDCNGEKYANGNQIWAGVVIATQKSIPIIEDWMKYSCMPDVICSEPDDIYNCHHRNDQSILTNLIIKYNIPTFINDNIFIDNQNYRNDPLTLERLQ